jgi:hypothetical protein
MLGYHSLSSEELSRRCQLKLTSWTWYRGTKSVKTSVKATEHVFFVGLFNELCEAVGSQLCSCSIASGYFMEPEGSLPHSQALSTCPDQSSPVRTSSYLSKIHKHITAFTSTLHLSRPVQSTHHPISARSINICSHVHIPSLRSCIQKIRASGSCGLFVRIFFFCYEGLLAPRPIPSLEDHPLSFVSDCLFSIFAAPLHT